MSSDTEGKDWTIPDEISVYFSDPASLEAAQKMPSEFWLNGRSYIVSMGLDAAGRRAANLAHIEALIAQFEK